MVLCFRASTKPQLRRPFSIGSLSSVTIFSTVFGKVPSGVENVCRLEMVGACSCRPVHHATNEISQRSSITYFSDRRSVLEGMTTIAIMCALFGSSSSASILAEENEIRKPYAPLEALLPATRVKIMIDQAADRAAILGGTDSSSLTEADIVDDLQRILLCRQNFFFTERRSSQRGGTGVLDQTTAKLSNVFTLRRTTLSPELKMAAAFEQSGERRQWRQLRRQEKEREQSNEIRAAFNYYTSNLRFGEEYSLTADPSEKSRLIRTYDKLPDVKAVITSDLDLRDLYRNEVLTAMDDARAELRYQVQRQADGENFEGKELLGLLRTAQGACGKWFSFIAERDVEDALAAVSES